LIEFKFLLFCVRDIIDVCGEVETMRWAVGQLRRHPNGSLTSFFLSSVATCIGAD